MNNTETFLLTIYTESALESQLLEEFDEFRVPGYTITNARGKGTRGSRSAAWEADSNIRVEVICGRKLAEELAERLQERYYDNYAMVLTISEVEVMRPTKFRRPQL